MVVRYARCFSSGAREPLDHRLLEFASKEQRALHEYVIAVRSKHVAHSQNWFQETDVAVTMRQDEEGASIGTIGAVHSSVVGLSFDMPARIRALATWIIAQVDLVIQEERPRLLAIAHELGVEKIMESGPAGFHSGVSDRHPKRGRSKP
jgi:hypothetical protein